MLIHLMPTLYAAFLAEDIMLEECSIPELGLCLSGGDSIDTRKPWPNKHYAVACKNVGRKAMCGFLIDTSEFVDYFTVTNIWKFNVSSARYRTKHVIKYIVHDKDYDVVTDDVMYWVGMHKSLGGWPSRSPSFAKDFIPVNARPRMDVFRPELTGFLRQGFVHDDCDAHGVVMHREEVFVMPTIERERFLTVPFDKGRMPTIDQAFAPFTQDVPF